MIALGIGGCCAIAVFLFQKVRMTSERPVCQTIELAVNADQSVSQKITVNQGNVDFSQYVRADIPVKVWKGTASSFQPGSGIEKSFDGDLNTIYHSNWNNSSPDYFPITLTYQFKDAPQIDYLVYQPRTTGWNGHFKEVEILYTTPDNEAFVSLGTFDFGGDGRAMRIELPGETTPITAVRFVVKSGAGDGQGFAVCAEMQFFKKAVQDGAFALFKDPLCTQLRDDVTQNDIDTCQNLLVRYLAQQIKAGTYSTAFRVNRFQPAYSPERLGELLHISNGYSLYQHVTGIVMEPGSHVVIVQGLKSGSSIGLRVGKLYAPDQEEADVWGLVSEYIPLHEGINVVKKSMPWTGLAYVDYYFEHPEEENEVAIHFVNGVENGYFDASKDTNEDWDRLLNNAVYPVFDAVGTHSHLAYPVADLKRYSAGKGVELLGVYDFLVEKQHEIIGLKKYGRVPANKIFARVNYAYYMFRDGDGVAFKYDTMDRVANPDNLKKNDEDACWGFSHEVGHVHQLSPYLSWGGLGETSNNICTRYCTQALGYPNRLEDAFQSAVTKFMGNSEAGKSSEARKSGGMKDTKIYSLDEDPDKALSYLEVGNFERLVPFWRLQCYFVNNGYEDFYPDLYERMRTAEERHPEMAQLSRTENVVPFQFNFIREASLLSGLNLYPYFEAYGFFRLLSLQYDDYAIFNYRMTKEMRDEFKAELEALEKKGDLKPLTPDQLDAMIHATE